MTAALPMVVPPLRLVAGFALTTAAAEAASVDPATLIRRWLDSKSPTARRTYARSLSRFAAWAIGAEASPEVGMRVLCEAGAGPATSMVERWRDELLQSNLAPGTVAGMVTALASLVRCCRRAGLIQWALEGVAPKAERRQDRSGPRRHDVQRLVECIDECAASGKGQRQRQAVRDAAIVRLLFCCGLRRAEAYGLRLEDVDLSAGVVKPRRKGKRERAPVSVSGGTAAALQRWMDARGSAPGPLFHGTRADANPTVHLSGESVRRLLRTWSDRAGIKVPVRPHGLRHSGATEVAARGSLAQLMSYGGWSSMTSASQYLDKHDEERRAAMEITDL
ncbi:MAG: site-specific integrase [Planctomycetes bacterium]|nr:site-specific integrase [Planctomycetota bacterium]